VLSGLLVAAALLAHPQQLSLQPFAQGLRPLTAIDILTDAVRSCEIPTAKVGA